MSNVVGITLGTDPEFFTVDSQSNQISSVAGKLGCDKWNKRVLAPDVRLQEDNVLAEIDVNAHQTFEAFDENIARGIQLCDDVVKAAGNVIIPNVSSHIYTPGELNTFHPSVFEFGCEPDFNALTGAMNPKPQAADPGLRTAGGHIHIGYHHLPQFEGENPLQRQQIIGVMCDYFLGMPSLMMDNDDRRRELYGKAGSCRFKDYGIEYRTLSNFWLFSQKTRRWAWDQMNRAFAVMNSGEWESIIQLVTPEEVQRVINENDKAMAERYIVAVGAA